MPRRWWPLLNTPVQENSEKMCTVHWWPVRNKGISRGFEPCDSWRELEQQCWLPPGVRPVAQKQSRMTASEQIDDPAPVLRQGKESHTRCPALVGRAG